MIIKKGTIVHFKPIIEILSMDFIIHEKGFCTFFIEGGYYNCHFKDLQKVANKKYIVEYEEQGFLKLKKINNLYHVIFLREDENV